MLAVMAEKPQKQLKSNKKSDNLSNFAKNEIR